MTPSNEMSDTMTRRDERLSVDQLHAMLQTAGVTMGPDSPLVGLPEAAETIEHEALAARGLTDPEWTRAIQTLQAPMRCVRVLKAFPDQTVVAGYYGDGTGADGLVGCWPESGTMRIGFPYDVEALLLDATKALGADFAVVRDPIVAELTPAGLAVLAAAIDVMRGRLLSSILARNTGIRMDLTPAQLHKVYAAGLAGTDGRWVVTLLRSLMPMSVELPETISDAGMNEVLDAGLLRVVGDHWQATEALGRLAAYLKTPLPAVAHEVVVLGAGKPVHYAYVIVMRGDGPAWTFEFWQEAGAVGVTLRSRMGGSYRRLLAGMIAPVFAQASPAEPDAAPAGATGPKFCSECGSPVAPGSAFCSECGAKL
jgi:hypothetical protein